VDHGGHVGHQEGARDPRKHAQQGGGPSQFGVQDHLAFKLIYGMSPSFDLGDLHTHGKIRRQSFQCHRSMVNSNRSLPQS
jgi:hypothetical protein